jgi:hypothetical protein
MDRTGDVIRYRFHTSVHLLPPQVGAGSDITIHGKTIHTLDVKPLMLANSLHVTFEDAASELQKLPRMFLELDGSFVWVSSQDDERWQVDGVLYDRGGRLMFVDLKGECPEEALQQLLRIFGHPQNKTPLMFQLVQQAVFLDENEFRRCCRVEDH